MKRKMKLGVAWYREDQWELLKSTASDSEDLEDTHQEWVESARRVVKMLRKQGFEPVKIDFDVSQFNDWCQENGKAVKSESRAEYTAILLKMKDGIS